MKKKTLLRIRSVCVTLLLFFTLSSWAETDGEWEYSVSDGSAVTSKYNGTSEDVTVPATLGGYTVTKIGDCTFKGNTSLKTVKFSSDIVDLGTESFSGCTGLTSIDVPTTVTNIGSNAFNFCSSLTKIELPKVKLLYYLIFYGCTNLTDLVISASANIGQNNDDLYNIPNITLVDEGIYYTLDKSAKTASVTNYDARSGSAPSILGSISFNSVDYTVTSIGKMAFMWKNLTNVTIPETVTTIGEYAFYGNPLLTNVIIPKSVTRLYGLSFFDCKKLETVEFLGSITLIDKGTFAGCESLISVKAPSVTSIEQDAFSSCNKLEKLVCSSGVTVNTSGNIDFSSIKDLILVKDGINYKLNQARTQATVCGYTGSRIYGGVYLATSVDYNGTACQVVNSYRGDGESNQSGMLYALDPDTKTVTVCGFSGYGTSPIFKETINCNGTDYPVTSIAESAFEGSWITDLFPIPASITTIGANAFKNCANLNFIQIRSTVTIGQGVFDGCTSLSWVGDETYLYYTIDKSTNTAAVKGLMSGGSSTDLEVPESIKIDQIGEFQITSVDTDGIWRTATSVKLPSTVTSIGDKGFASASSLTSIEIPTSVTNIGKYAFSKSEALTSITIPEGVTTIGEFAFYNCTALKSISFPSTLTSLGTEPFDGCSSLDTVTFAGPILTECSEYYYNCKKFTAVLSNGLCLSLRRYADYYFNVTGFSGTGTEATVPTKFLGVDVRNVESMTLSDDAAVTSITVPSSITINKDAFSNCGKLRLVNGDYSYKLNEGDKTLTFTIASYNGSATDVTLPSSAWGFAVTAVGEKAFENKTSITNVTIPSSITSIEAYAFSGCTGLTSIDIPSTVATVGDYAFNNCTGITSKSYDASTTILGENVFAGNTEMSSHTDTSTGLVCSVNTASKSVAVTGYKGTAVSLTVPTGITYNGETYSIVEINAGAFKDASVTSIVIPQTVKVFPGAFDYEKTTALADDNSMTYALNDADKTASVTGYSGSSTGVVVPVSIWGYDVTAINSNAFGENTTMTSITVPSAVPSFASGTFDSCSKLTTYKDENGFSYSLSDGAASVTGYSGSATEVEIPGTIWNNTVTSIASSAFKSKSTITSVKIPESVTSIGSYAFYGCSALASVNIPEKVTSISAYLFYDCKKLSSVTIPEDVTIIGNYAFYQCNMSSIKIPSTVGSIGTYAFCATGLTSVEIPSSVTSLSDYLFSDCGNLESVSIPETVTSIGKYVFKNCSKLTNETLVIPSSVTSMGEGVFYGCTGLTDIILLSSASKFEDSMFYGCTGLTKVTIPDGVTSIGYNAFCECTGLTEVIIPDGVTSIGYNAFRKCTGLTEVIIPNGVTSIDGYAFSGCSGLQKINIPSSVTSLGSYVFQSCSKLEDVDLPSSVTSIGKYAFSGTGITKIVLPPGATEIVEGMFYYCEALKSLDVPETVTTIGIAAFKDCTGLTEVDLPSTVKNLGYSVFSGCSNLKDVTIRSSKIGCPICS
jgi:hypothetical protein